LSVTGCKVSFPIFNLGGRLFYYLTNLEAVFLTSNSHLNLVHMSKLSRNKMFSGSSRVPAPSKRKAEKKNVSKPKSPHHSIIVRPIKMSRNNKLLTAIRLLNNNRLSPFDGGVVPKHLAEFDDEKSSAYSFDADSMSVAASMVDLGTVYRFRLVHVTGSITASAGGILSGYQNADPSGGAGSTWTSVEWSALISLFSEVRNVNFSWICTPYRNNLLLQSGQLLVSGVLSSIAAAPTTADQVWDNADAVPYAIGTDTSKFGLKHTVHNTLSELSWAIVTTPTPGSYAGCPGAIQWLGGGFTASVVVAQTAVEGIYEFRSRI